MYKNKIFSKNAVDFIDNVKLHNLMEFKEDAGRFREVLAKSKELKPLSAEETAVLIAAKSPAAVEEIFQTAKELKKRVYGNRIVIFAPLYVGNFCINDCKYCAFRRSLRTTVRKTLSPDETISEVKNLEKLGHKRLILVFGEHPSYTPEFMAETVRNVYAVKTGHGGEIRRVNINAAPLDVEGYKIIKESGIGTYQIFQETYHLPTYQSVHPANTHKGDFLWRLDGLSRAFEAGCDDMGLGALFGLYDWRFELLSLIEHANFLQKNYNVGPHTISFPRLQPAHGVSFDDKYFVSDFDFMRLVAILRLSTPYTGLILTARENAEIRNKVLEFGVSQIDAGTKLELGGYSEKKSEQDLKREQFRLGDVRSLDEIIGNLISNDYIPSFCTSCYRLGRTGERFMEYAIPGFIGDFCTPNALLTLAEYLEDYASPEVKANGEKMLAAELEKITEPERKKILADRIEKIKNGARDLYF